MRTVFRFLVVIIGCLHLCGGHYGVLQVIAWTQMIIEYSGEKGIVQGTIQTFDGDHPCKLCLSISEARKEQREQPVDGGRQTEIALKNLLVPETICLDPSRPKTPPVPDQLDPSILASRAGESPPSPPPRITTA